MPFPLRSVLFPQPPKKKTWLEGVPVWVRGVGGVQVCVWGGAVTLCVCVGGGADGRMRVSEGAG
jgi:hypothetical protein